MTNSRPPFAFPPFSVLPSPLSVSPSGSEFVEPRGFITSPIRSSRPDKTPGMAGNGGWEGWEGRMGGDGEEGGKGRGRREEGEGDGSMGKGGDVEW